MAGNILPGYLELEERVVPQLSPVAGESIIYPKSDGVWYQMNSVGVESVLTSRQGLQDFQNLTSYSNLKTLNVQKGQAPAVGSANRALRAIPAGSMRRFDVIMAATTSGGNQSLLRSDVSFTGPAPGTTTAVVNGRVMAVLATAASLNATKSFVYTMTSRKANSNYLPYMCGRFSMGSVVTQLRFYIGFSTVQPFTSDAPSSQVAACLRYSTAAADAGFVGYVLNSSGSVGVTSSLGTVSANTDYVFEIFVRGSSIYFALNYGTPTVITSPDISAETALGDIIFSLQTLDTNAKTVNVSGMYASEYSL